MLNRKVTSLARIWQVSDDGADVCQPLEGVTMAKPRRTRLVRTLAVPVLAAAVVALLPLANSDASDIGQVNQWTPMSPVSVAFQPGIASGSTVQGHILGFNDFHGAIDPPTGSGAAVNGIPAGGAEYLGYWVKKLRAQARQQTPYVYTVAAGDNIGASPLVSAAFHDEPAIEALNAIGLDISSVGNHEYDEGVKELERLQRGGCHPVDGCQDGDGFDGADFEYLAANVVKKSNGLPHLAPITLRWVGGVLVGFVGMTLEGTPGIVNPAGITSVEFKDEIATANFYADVLKRFLGVRAMVLTIHEGGTQSTPPSPIDPSSCANFAGAITPIVAGLRPEFGVVVSGHTHRFYTCELPNSAGKSVVTSAGTNGQLVTDISFTLDKRTKKFVTASARNQITENGVRNPDGTWQTTAPGVFVRNPDTVDPQVKAIADKYRAAVAPLANRVIGTISANIVRDVQPNQESPLGDVIADAQLRYTQSAGAQIALMNPGGIRASLSFANSPGGEAPGQVTYGEAFTVQPFNNLVVTQTFTGAQIKDVLEQQFPIVGGVLTLRILQVSNGFTYTYDSTAPAGSRISNLELNDVAIDPAATYRVTTNDFLANGGDGFTALTAGTNRVTAPGFDVDALIAHLATGPIGPGPANRITRTA
jgi:5'-nucleotidase